VLTAGPRLTQAALPRRQWPAHPAGVVLRAGRWLRTHVRTLTAVLLSPQGRQVLLRDAGGLTPGTGVTNSGAAGRSSVWSPGGHGLSASPWMCSDIASIGSGDFGRPVR
jgi:hypothetical protein